MGTYYVLSTENSPRGFQATYLYVDQDLLYTFRHQMSLAQGRLPQGTMRWPGGGRLAGPVRQRQPGWGYRHPGHPQLLRHLCGHRHPGPGDGGRGGVSHGPLPTPPWRGGRTTTPAGYLAYVHLAGDQTLSAEAIEAFYRQTAEDLDLPVPGFSNVYFRYHDSSYLREVLPMVLVLGALVLAGGCLVIQSIFRISIQDKIQSYGQLRTWGPPPGRSGGWSTGRAAGWGSLGLLAGVVLGALVGGPLPPGVPPPVLRCGHPGDPGHRRGMVALAVRKPAKIAAGIAPLEAMRFVPDQRAVPPRKAGRGPSPPGPGLAELPAGPAENPEHRPSLSLGGILLLNIASISLVQDPAGWPDGVPPGGLQGLPLLRPGPCRHPGPGQPPDPPPCRRRSWPSTGSLTWWSPASP